MNVYAVTRYRYLNKNAVKGETLFVGSSLMEHFPINEILMSRGLSKVIYNRGISGYTIPELLESMDEQMLEKYTTDGIHMWPCAYELIFDNMKKYIF